MQISNPRLLAIPYQLAIDVDAFRETMIFGEVWEVLPSQFLLGPLARHYARPAPRDLRPSHSVRQTNANERSDARPEKASRVLIMLVKKIIDPPEYGNVRVDLIVRGNIDDRVARCSKAWCQAEPVSINPRTDMQNSRR